jgi:hypothetical protein
MHDLVKSPYAALYSSLSSLRRTLKSTPHSEGFVRLASGVFYKVVEEGK